MYNTLRQKQVPSHCNPKLDIATEQQYNNSVLFGSVEEKVNWNVMLYCYVNSSSHFVGCHQETDSFLTA
jgi:hypothetical protein